MQVHIINAFGYLVQRERERERERERQREKEREREGGSALKSNINHPISESI